VSGAPTRPAGAGEGIAACDALGSEDRAALLRIAREALAAAVLGRAGSAPGSATGAGTSRAAERTGGAFVSLHARDGELRGCVGLLRCDGPLHETVARMAVAAGMDDGRFPPVRADELEGLVLEISALGELVRVRPDEVEVGRHGVLIRADGLSGVLLPQVAVHHGWSRDEFLTRTAVKAGLSRDAWRRADVELFAFTAEVFGEA
jgi:AmmeMemoRadiSam system protein A